MLQKLVIKKTKMIKDYFQKNNEVLNDLRSEHFKYTEYLNKGKYKLKQKFFGKGKKHYDFDINSQEYFHQEVNDICFESPEAQEEFFNIIEKALSTPFQCRIDSEERGKEEDPIPLRKSPSECRAQLVRHYATKIENLRYKRYMILSRFHNMEEKDDLAFVESRTNLIDKEVQMAINRQTRLQQNDYFEESFVQGGKPVPVSETGQPIYKYLDEEECWFSNIMRDDIIAFTRNIEHKREILNEYYYSLESKVESIVLEKGIEIILQIEDTLLKDSQNIAKSATLIAENFNNIVERQLQLISPGNLVEKQNLNNFGYTIFGIIENRNLKLPLYPAIFPELQTCFTQAISPFFKGIKLLCHNDIISLIPKLNSFNQTIFKYQNKEILEGKKEIKLGLQDDIDVKKQLETMLEAQWVKKHVVINFQRFDYKMELKSVDWPLDSITQQLQRQKNREKSEDHTDANIKELVKIMAYEDYHSFRKHMKKRSEKIISRARGKYFDMENINYFNKKTGDQMTLQELSELFRVKFDENQFAKEPFLKAHSLNFFNKILEKYWLSNPAQIEIQETLKCLHIRENRTKTLNLFNAMRCYQRSLCFDLRVQSGKEFKFKLDDQYLINSNKQVIENFQRSAKQTGTFFTRNSNENSQGKTGEGFILEKEHEKSSMFKKDIVETYYFDQEVPHVLVKSGRRKKISIVYNVSLEDLNEMEERIIKYSTAIINQYERYVKIRQLEDIVDRVELLKQMYQLQMEFTFKKFKLIEQYYYVYENTPNILEAFKVSKIIIQLLQRNPVLDIESLNTIGFEQMYRYQIEALFLEENVLELTIAQMKKAEQEKIEKFHHLYSEAMQVPLSAQVYLYRDMEQKQRPKNKLQRMNSVSSRISSKSSKAHSRGKPNGLSLRQQIRQEFDEGDSDQSFDIENYDEYLLRKDMDAIFDDMAEKEDTKQQVQISAATVENAVINPMFEGGPYPFNQVVSSFKITSQKHGKLLSFYETVVFASNIRRWLQDLQNQFKNRYGTVSKTYQFCLIKVLGEMTKKIVLNPICRNIEWKSPDSNNQYHQNVTASCLFYEEIMGPSLDPPSNIQMAMNSTIQKHQEKLPSFNVLSKLDYHSIECLVSLNKPQNSASYRELSLGINYILYLDLKQMLRRLQLKRERLIQSYQALAQNCDTKVQKFGGMYSRSGQSDVFMSIQELKQYREDNFSNPIFPDTIEEIRVMIQCQKSDIKLFETALDCSKTKLENLIIMYKEIGQKFHLNKFPSERLHSNDQKTVKIIKARVKEQLSNRSMNEFKHFSFFKIKEKLLIKVDKLIKQVQQANLSSITKFKGQKTSEFCKSLLEDKLKKQLKLEIIQRYSKDLLDTQNRCKIYNETDSVLQRLTKHIKGSPYLIECFDLAPENASLESKVFYDQKKSSEVTKLNEKFLVSGKVTKPKYIYSRQQLSQEWSEQDILFRANNLNEFKIHWFEDFSPPSDKEKLLKWMYRIPNFSYPDHERIALSHFINFTSSFTGKIAQSEYVAGTPSIRTSTNKFMTIYNYYRSLLTYIEMNILLIGLQMEKDTFQSFEYLLERNVDFEKAYPLADKVSIHESLQSLEKKYMETCFNYKCSEEDNMEEVRRKFKSKGYLQKKQHWAVYDQVIDFIVSKIEGRGVIRENFLPFSEEMKKGLQSEDVQDIFKVKVEQIKTYFMLATYECYLNQQHSKPSKALNDLVSSSDQNFYHYMTPLHRWFIQNKVETFGLSNDPNRRFNLGKLVKENEKESQRFIFGLFDHQHKFETILERYKSALITTAVNVEEFTKGYVRSKVKNQKQEEIEEIAEEYTFYNFSFLNQGIETFKSLGEDNRLKIFSRMRYFFEKIGDYMKIKEIKPSVSIQVNNTMAKDDELTKLKFANYLYKSKIISLSTIFFSEKVRFPCPAKTFVSASSHLKESIEISAFNIFNRFEDYKAENKIQFSKNELSLMSSSEQSKRDPRSTEVYNKTLREIIQTKLTKEQFKWRVISESIKVLKNQKLPIVEAKKIINTSLIPRVHLIASYSSPLVMDRKTFISQQYKLAFAQAFINRFRNKVSRVDLLSSGYGFVITVPDLQDCVNFMNKLLFTFTEKEFKYRQQTYQQYFEIMVDSVNQKNRAIQDQANIIEKLKQKVGNITEAQYLGKVTKLLQEKVLVEDKLKYISENTNGLQDRVRKTVQAQYEKKISSLELENSFVKKKFNEFKELLVVLTKDSAKSNYENMATDLKLRTEHLLEKKVDINEMFLQHKLQESKAEKVNVNATNRNSERIANNQTCALDEDVIHDPYYTTKLINKMRIFNIFKLGCHKISSKNQVQTGDSKLKKLQKIQDVVIAQSERQMMIREELKKTQENLSMKVNELERLKQSYENLDNERTKLKILVAGKDKKIEQKERQASQSLKKVLESERQPQEIDKLPSLSPMENQTEKNEKSSEQKKAAIRTKRISKKQDKSLFLTNYMHEGSSHNPVYDRFELSNLDKTWREKCQELYIENKKLLNEVSKFQSGLTTPTREHSLHIKDTQRRHSINSVSEQNSVREGSAGKRIGNLSFKFNLMKQNFA